jgi:hypothetical protein
MSVIEEALQQEAAVGKLGEKDVWSLHRPKANRNRTSMFVDDQHQPLKQRKAICFCDELS